MGRRDQDLLNKLNQGYDVPIVPLFMPPSTLLVWNLPAPPVWRNLDQRYFGNGAMFLFRSTRKTPIGTRCAERQSLQSLFILKRVSRATTPLQIVASARSHTRVLHHTSSSARYPSHWLWPWRKDRCVLLPRSTVSVSVQQSWPQSDLSCNSCC